jgi:hypothetical protein
MLANDRCCTCDRSQCDRSSIRVIMRTRGSFNLVGTLDSVKLTSSLLIEGGN